MGNKWGTYLSAIRVVPDQDVAWQNYSNYSHLVSPGQNNQAIKLKPIEFIRYVIFPNVYLLIFFFFANYSQ